MVARVHAPVAAASLWHVDPSPCEFDFHLMADNDPGSQPNNPLHGITLMAMLDHLVEVYGWEELGARIDIRCFVHDPSIKSSLKFLRKTEWARSKVERLYLKSIRHGKRDAAAGGKRDVSSDESNEVTAPKVAAPKAEASRTVARKTDPTPWDR